MDDRFYGKRKDDDLTGFKDIPGYEGLYAANRNGEIYSYLRNKIITPISSHHNYKRVRLYKDRQFKTYAVHRLIGSTFIPNPNGYPEINHINEDQSDNRASNLEWCTREYNMRYGNSRNKLKIPVAMLNDEGGIIKTFNSQLEASIETGIGQGAISNACVGRAKHAGGWRWAYVNKNGGE